MHSYNRHLRGKAYFHYIWQQAVGILIMFSSAGSGSFRILFMGIQPPMVGHGILHPFQNCWCLFSQVKFFIYLALQEQPGSEAIGAAPVPTGPSLGALPHWVVRVRVVS